MANAQHTPILEYHRGGDYAVLMRPEDTTDDACITLRFDTDEDCDQWGNLIAAAPEMLNSLIEMLESRYDLPPLIYDRARAAIAKAKGGL